MCFVLFFSNVKLYVKSIRLLIIYHVCNMDRNAVKADIVRLINGGDEIERKK